MKKLAKYLKIGLFFSLIGLFHQESLLAQSSVNEAGIEKQITAGNFTFKANSVLPQRGRTRFLDGTYDVRINKDSVISYLPYFGVSDQAPLSSDDAGIKFTSTKFSYSTTPRKKRSWNVKLVFNDQSSARQFNFTIYEDGTASLDVTSNFREPISFRGYIKKDK